MCRNLFRMQASITSMMTAQKLLLGSSGAKRFGKGKGWGLGVGGSRLKIHRDKLQRAETGTREDRVGEGFEKDAVPPPPHQEAQKDSLFKDPGNI